MVQEQNKPFKRHQPSAKHRPKQLEAASFQDSEGCYCFISNGNYNLGQKCSNSEPREMLCTADVVSTVGRIWNQANQSLAFLQPKQVIKSSVEGSPKEVGLDGSVLVSSDYICLGSSSSTSSSSIVQQNSDNAVVAPETPVEFCSYRSWRYSRDVILVLIKPWKGMRCINLEIPIKFRLAYLWMRQADLSGLRLPVTTNQCDNAVDCCTSSVAGRAASSQRNVIIFHNPLKDGCGDFSGDLTKFEDLNIGDEANKIQFFPSLSSDYLLRPVKEPQKEIFVWKNPDIGPCASYHGDSAQTGFADEKYTDKMEKDELFKTISSMNPYLQHNYKGELETEIPADKVQDALAKKEHAVSGALAGVFVSLCLHPIDTVKTVIQSCRADQKSLYFIGQSIVSERGLTGLYRGIGSNIATSAPISAIYTFSYETVKVMMLPYLQEEYHSVAYCTAGGCASLATSFVFTPSERIKQQMQVSSHYQNCWNAFTRIMEKGGLPSLYAGWGAVLCRNVPHSIIKFYTYETLKQNVLSSKDPDVQPNTWQTLLCGGLAGSTAALFSTPFDVVKTRLQVQIPGSVKPYSSIFNALQEIYKYEGVKGLYRGLTPRLIMYVTQGALFFTSYEFFKNVFSLKNPLHNTHCLHRRKV